MTDLFDLAAVHEACPAGAAQTAVGGSRPSAVASSQVVVPLYYALPSIHQQPVCSHLRGLEEEALERLTVVALFVALVSAEGQSTQTVATCGVPAADLLLLLAHLLSSGFLPLHFEVFAVDAAVRVSSATCVHHHAVKVHQAAGCHPDAVVHHATHFCAVVQAPAAIYLFVAAAVHRAVSAPHSAAAATTVLVAAELAQLVVVGQYLLTGPVPAYFVDADANHSQTAAAVSVEVVSASDPLLRVAVAAVAVLPAAAAENFPAASASTDPSQAVVVTVSVVARTSAAQTQLALVAAAAAAVPAAELPQLLFVCPAHAHASADLTQSVTVVYTLPADQLSFSQLSLHKFLQRKTYAIVNLSPDQESCNLCRIFKGSTGNMHVKI